MSARHIFLTGHPDKMANQIPVVFFQNVTPKLANISKRVGKTTLIHQICDALTSTGTNVQGFYTEEIRSGGRRTGFDVVTLDGKRGSLARVSDSDDGLPSGKKREYRVGQYTVNLQSFEQTALPSLQKKPNDRKYVVVIDEIGKMELFSQTFVQSVRSILDACKSKNTVLATIPIAKGKPIPFVEELRHRSDALVFTISENNRNSVLSELVQAVQESVSS